MLAVPGLFEVATRLFGLVGLTLMKLSAWLPVVALTFTTASRQATGTNNRSFGFCGRSGGFMHLRVPSGTLIPWGVVWTCACEVDVVGMMNARRAASIIRLRRVFM